MSIIDISKRRRLVVAVLYAGWVAARLAMCMLVAIVILSLTSCDPCRRCVRPSESVRTEYVYDTILVHERVVDSQLVARLFDEFISVMSPISDTARAETEYAWAWAYLDAMGINLSMKNKTTAPVKVKIVYRDTSRMTEMVKSSKDVEVVRERYVPKFVAAMAVIGGIVVIVLLSWCVWSVFRRML